MSNELLGKNIDRVNELLIKHGQDEISDCEHILSLNLRFMNAMMDEFGLDAGTEEKKLKRLIRDIYNQIQLSHTTNQHNLYTWDELNPELSARIREVI